LLALRKAAHMPDLTPTEVREDLTPVLVSIDQIREAAASLPDDVRDSPLIRWDGDVWLKLETLQPTGSFKIRGALTKLRRLPIETRHKGVVAYSSGNHGVAVARAARLFGTSATIVVPQDAPSSKLAAIMKENATLVFCPPGSEERRVRAQQIAIDTGRTLIAPYNDADVISGQGTIGLELVQQLPHLSAVLVPVGGGGLISGIAAAVKALKPSVRVIGVEPEFAADARDSLAAGIAVEWPADQVGRTIADALRTQSLGPLSVAHVVALVDEIVTVSEAEILDAAVTLFSQRRIVVEPAGAVAMAALRHPDLGGPGTAVVVSGGNPSVELLTEILHRIEDAEISTLRQTSLDESHLSKEPKS
jgi:threonine dehydratase